MKGQPMHPIHHAKGNFDMSKDEFRRIENAMKQPEFAGMLNDYMLEISDPKNKDEYDEYLKQLQKEGDLPKELKLVKPQPGFCMKTTISSKKDKSQSQKLFINCCHSPVVECPSFETIVRDGKTGQNWRLPYSAGKMRYDQNSKKEVCTTIDIAFHPYTFQLVQANHQFLELVCQTALDGANQQMGERNEIISKDYKVLKNMKCKGGEPALLTIRLSGTVGDHIKKMQEKQQQEQQQQQQPTGPAKSETERRQNGEGYESSLYRDILNQKKEYTDEQIKKMEEKKRLEEASEINEESIEAAEQANAPIQAPKYKIVYSYPVQYEDFLDRREESHLKRPIELTVEIKLPRANTIKEINLDIEERNLVLNVAEKYFLDIQLPYFVQQDDGSAKFDGKKKLLRVRLPINKSKLPADPTPPKTYKEFDEQGQVDSAEGEKVENEDKKIEENQNEKVEEKQVQGQDQGQEQREPLLEIKDKKLVNINQLNVQAKEQFLAEDDEQANAPRIEVVGEQQEQSGEAAQTEDVLDEDDVAEDNSNNTNNLDDKVALEHPHKRLELVESKPKLIEKLSFKRQETIDKQFLVFNLPGYDREQVKYCLFDQKVLIFYEDKQKKQYIQVDVAKSFKQDSSDISFVIDYVVVNLDKEVQEYWKEEDIKVQEAVDLETFELVFGELTEAKRLYEESRLDKNEEEIKTQKGVAGTEDQKQETTEEATMDGLDGLDGDDNGDKDNSLKDTEKEQPKQANEKIDVFSKEDTQVIKLKEDGISKNVLQFIEFKDIPCAYELD